MPDDFKTEILDNARQQLWKEVQKSEHDGWACNGGVTDPDEGKLQEFFNCLSTWVNNDGEKRKALDFVRSLPRGKTRAYDTKTLLYQTALRTAHPENIWQGKYGFCGPAAILYHFAKHWPEKYARCVWDLHTKREGMLMVKDGGGLRIRADVDYDTQYDRAGVNNTCMGPADFVVLHAIRRAAEETKFDSFTIATPGRDEDATKPSAMVKLLEYAGYRNIIDKTLWKGPAVLPERDPTLNAVISECMTVLRSNVGPVVILLSHPWLSIHAGNPLFPWAHPNDWRPDKLAKLHWVCVTSLQYDPASTKYRMSFMSLGCVYPNTEFDRDVFRKCFYGFISALP